MNINQINPLVLAYVGDAIYELKIRSYLVSLGYNKVNKLQNKSMNFVTAKSQSKILNDLIDNDFFTDKELEIIKRGRNTKSVSHPKNTDIITYKWATGFEALLGYLYLENDIERIDEIIREIIGE